MSEEMDAAERQRAASDPSTPAATLADLAYDYPDLRAAIAGNAATYEGLLEWLGELDDPAVNAALTLRSRGVLPATPSERLAPIAEEPAATGVRWPAFLTRRFVAVLGGIVALLIVAIIVVSSVHNATDAALASADSKAQRAAADRASAAADKASAANGSKSSHSASTAASTPTPTPTQAPHPASNSPIAQNVWRFANQDKYSYSETIQVWAPLPHAKVGVSHPGNSAVTLGSTCSYNPNTDLVIPASIGAIATTPNFKTSLEANALFVNGSSLGAIASGNTSYSKPYAGPGTPPADGDNRVSVFESFTSGPVCKDYSSTNIWGYGHAASFGVNFGQANNGQGGTSDMFIIVRNYFSPATPNGDSALLDWITIRPMFSGSAGTSGQFVDVDSNDLGAYSGVGMTLSGQILRP